MEDDKLPLKRVELSLSKFNEVAIPHHLDLLRQHKANIFKYEEAGDYARVRTEQCHARRVTSQLRGLLDELHALRARVTSHDLPRFDDLTRRSRELTLRAVQDYLENQRAPEVAGAGAGAGASVVSTESVGVLPQLQLQLEVDQQEQRLAAMAAALAGWRELQGELQLLLRAWDALHRAAAAQRELVTSTQQSVEVAAQNVQLGRAALSHAERLRAGMWGAGGAVVGAAVGGPLGLVVGGKLAALAALSGSIAGYIGGKIIGSRRQLQIQEAETDLTDTDTHTDKSKDD